ncbi:hypothetical protein A2291_06010 [candidate division WOR-1 bacterium RIFOXYB2_FULL_42_35]|uniref:DUF262 domain-containing protein n=1 Tax=candidate division WOR-1 bacterium RIFOXYC2_FULL_41_25 TaxID=1802586 RepID=A0A1F4TJJ6_UNCSA|nr:MAG: hypothetical protein A2247_01670 [candidate division WOR-1 bacterium RIFOXYA2_FULL_41_14]OGC22279.1 MAG: hypothetical protein A2291_06010 [candidate division WOR-1 bacterium RIFOXYB2_FULL_42_35]OGC32898.1 MAG: hypothetical protein A2462_00685 [candidate division WOR-1 bacterium RIFOXYC2_FULL_41_25]
MAELNVSRKNIGKLLKEMQGKKFIIPDYQRPYKWDEEKCETLWGDIIDFFSNKKPNEEYFLGSIVTCKGAGDKDSNEIEIIDGQQRITSLFLLLRSFYAKLESMCEDDNIKGLKNQIAPCLWDVHEISNIVEDKTKIHIESRVATESDNEIFHKILTSGKIISANKDLYSSNYAFFYSKCNEYAQKNPMHWQPLCITILNKCIVLPIECEDVEAALTIFSTLNDRGMPLSDSDIFKAQIYRSKKTTEEKKEFTDAWKELTETVEDAQISLDDLFRYYSHIVRAKNKDKSKEIGLRNFYKTNNSKILKDPSLMGNLSELADFWFDINNGGAKTDDDKKTFDFETKKYLHCLKCYPNEYWKYLTSVYYFKNKDQADFAKKFPLFLRKLIAFLFAKFIEQPTVNAIKDNIYQFGIDICANNPFQVNLSETFSSKIGNSVSLKIAKSIILLSAYLDNSQTELIPNNFEIEHIFPRKWQDTNYNGWNKKDAEEYLEKFGNKAPIEKKVNIQAGNGYFGKKKEKYKQSKISTIIKLSKTAKSDWLKQDIEEREKNTIETLMNFFRESSAL